MEERSGKTVRLKERTANSFGFEWSHFDTIYSQYENNFLSYVWPLEPDSFKNKKVIDAGCGAGRHSYFLAKYGAEVTAFDFSPRAVQAARTNLGRHPNVNVVQEDIYHLPDSWQDRFDIVLCIGVLHHLPDPREGFRQLLKIVKPGGMIAIWVYGKRDNKMAQVLYEPTRRVTTRIPHQALYYLSWLPAAAVEAANRTGAPLFRHYSQFPFRTKWNDAFDVLSAPRANYYDLGEIQSWYEEAGLKDTKITERMLGGKAKGIRGIGTR